MEAIWRKVSVRDVAFLKTAVRFQHWPKQVSDEANRLAPPGERWAPESKERAEERARDLIALGALQWRGSEVETTELGRNLIAYGERQR